MASDKNVHIHKDHRKRLRSRFNKDGVSSFEDHQILELLLFYSIPRSDTNPLAHRLLDRFGSLNGVLCAGRDELMEVTGIGKKSAELIMTISSLSKKSELGRLEDKLMDKFVAGAYFTRYMWGYDAPDSAVMLVDDKEQLITVYPLSRGAELSTEDILEEILKLVTKNNAAAIALTHRHNGGEAEPSFEDIASTKQIEDALNRIGVSLIEHFIITDKVTVPFYDDIRNKEKSMDNNDRLQNRKS